MLKDKKIILASASPRRIEMMAANGLNPQIMPAHIEENIPPKDGMCETAMFLALKKAQAVESEYLAGGGESGPVIIAADTIVYKDGEIMGKPEDAADGFRMLDKLRNDHHYVVTGVALLEAGARNTRVFAEVTKVYFKDYSDEELHAYLATDEAYDKAGAYAIQGYFARHIDRFEGSYENVIGFPWDRIVTELEKL